MLSEPVERSWEQEKKVAENPKDIHLYTVLRCTRKYQEIRVYMIHARAMYVFEARICYVSMTRAVTYFFIDDRTLCIEMKVIRIF